MRRSGKFLAAALSVALVLATPLSAQATKSGLSDAKSKKTALEAEKKKTEQELKNLEGLKSDTTAYVKKLDSSLESIGNELSKRRKSRSIRQSRNSPRRRRRRKASMNP